MLVLGIESTCDETACAVVEDGQFILSNVIASQIDLHRKYGGVVPELASRHHIEVIIFVLQEALEKSGRSLKEIDLIAVAYGPGLIGTILIGLNTAKALSLALRKPFIGVNHIEAHLYASLMSQERSIQFPCLGIVLSGGHTALILMKDLGQYELLGQTVDDAIGEAFDKVAKMLGLPYPGGPEIEQLAVTGNSYRYPFKISKIKNHPFNFSFSGLKTAVLYLLKKYELNQPSQQDKADLAASFQRIAFQDVIKKGLMAAHQYEISTILLGGGVTNNRYLRDLFAKENQDRYRLVWPLPGLSLDNGAMIGGLGYHRYRIQGKGDPFNLEPLARISF